MSKWWRENPYHVPDHLRSADVVYFIGSVHHAVVKIGMTGNVLGRIRTIQSSFPSALRIFLVLPGERRLEEIVHRKFAELRMKGEWFHLGQELVDWITYRGGVVVNPTHNRKKTA